MHAPPLVLARSRNHVARFCVLVALLWAAIIDVAAFHAAVEVPPPASQLTEWRRTRDGWRQTHEWAKVPAARPPDLHPLTVAALIALVSALALVAFDRPVVARPHNRPPLTGPHYPLPRNRRWA